MSSLGRIRNDLTQGILKPWKTSGYHKVEIWNDNGPERFRVHRIVAEAFIPNPANKPTVNHRDGNPINNVVKNLEWNTVEENQQWNDFLAFQRVIERLKASKDGVYSLTDLVKVAETEYTLLA